MNTQVQQIKSLVDEKIAGKKVMIFSKTWCGYCSRVKAIMKEYLGKELDSSDYEVMEIDRSDQEEKIQDYLRDLTGARSVPRVFINHEKVGGCDDVQRLQRSGELKKMLTKA